MNLTQRITRHASSSAMPSSFIESVAHTFACETCKREFSTQTQLRQHLRRKTCRGNLNLSTNPCDICGREFSTYTGLRLHHSNENNAKDMQLVKASTRLFWTADEEHALALMELNMGPTTSSAIIVHLTSNSGRTRDAIKKRRQSASYKTIIQRLRSERATAREEVEEILPEETHPSELSQEIIAP
ncbi:hypothetical protein GQX74_013380 [Glossina fuscipes]|nr:hypothetical protein GQX74_013380 [Glossina fuscipes]